MTKLAAAIFIALAAANTVTEVLGFMPQETQAGGK
jgi:hypothetical protein